MESAWRVKVEVKLISDDHNDYEKLIECLRGPDPLWQGLRAERAKYVLSDLCNARVNFARAIWEWLEPRNGWLGLTDLDVWWRDGLEAVLYKSIGVGESYPSGLILLEFDESSEQQAKGSMQLGLLSAWTVTLEVSEKFIVQVDHDDVVTFAAKSSDDLQTLRDIVHKFTTL